MYARIPLLLVNELMHVFSISSMNYVYNSAWASGRPSIVSMSLGGSVSTSLDNAVTTVSRFLLFFHNDLVSNRLQLTNAGIHVVVATGNSASDARNFSPAQAASAITVGATSITDSIASFSNFGPAVDVFTPGVSITSTWIGSTTVSPSF
jgi:cerevisin